MFGSAIKSLMDIKEFDRVNTRLVGMCMVWEKGVIIDEPKPDSLTYAGYHRMRGAATIKIMPSVTMMMDMLHDRKSEPWPMLQELYIETITIDGEETVIDHLHDMILFEMDLGYLMTTEYHNIYFDRLARSNYNSLWRNVESTFKAIKRLECNVCVG